MAGSYKDLVAWRKAMRMALEIYRATRAFPKDETYGLGNQLRRAAVSVPSNIAEGQGRYSRREFQHFLNNARGSLAEIETQILLARELVYLSRTEADGLLMKAGEVGRILNGLIAATRKEVFKS
jgi:four helix bundle protein